MIKSQFKIGDLVKTKKDPKPYITVYNWISNEPPVNPKGWHNTPFLILKIKSHSDANILLCLKGNQTVEFTEDKLE